METDCDRCGSLTFETIEIGMKVIDVNNIIGIIRECDDIHNILIEYCGGGKGLYCLDEDCELYEPIYEYGI